MISIISPVDLVQAPILASSLNTISIILLVTLLALKGLASASARAWQQVLGRYLTIAIGPLLITFFIITVIRVADFLR